MHYEVWDLETGNLIGEYDTEEGAFDLVRRALAQDWSADRLAVGVEFDDHDTGDDGDLPPALHGAALAARALGTDAAGMTARRQLS